MELKMTYQQAREQLIDEGFVNVDIFLDPLIDAIEASINAARKMNIVYYGPAGYGKSTIPSRYIEILTGERPGVLPIYRSLDFEDSFGGINLPLYQKEGIRRLNADNSWIKKNVVIFEEAYDGSEAFLAAYKEVISSGMIDGVPLDTKLIIICTNRPPSIFQGKPEMEALNERFPIKVKIDWSNLNTWEYEIAAEAICKKMGLTHDDLLSAIGQLAAGNQWSPRRIEQTALYLINRASARNREPEQNDILVAASYLNFDATDISQMIVETRQRKNADSAKNAIRELARMHASDYRAIAAFERTGVVDDDIQVIIDKIYKLRKLAVSVDETRGLVRELQIDQVKYGEFGGKIAVEISGELTALMESMARRLSEMQGIQRDILAEIMESGQEQFVSPID